MTNFDGCEARGAVGAGLRATLWLLLLVCGPVLAAYGQGKIAGRITDTTGEALIGVNILIEGTQQGAVTDTGGHYVILNVRPGAYTLAFSYIGFQTQRLTDVRVSTGQTTRHDLRLREQIIEGQEIIVRAERPLVQKDLTASKKTFIAEEIDALPVESLFGLLATQAGITTGAGGELHIRGGRSNEISYLVDGLSVSNPFNTNGIATRVATDAIEELTVISGAFNAEYGKAMSGIVNLVTKEGGNHLTGSVSFYGGDYVTGNDDLFFTPSSVDLNTYTFEGSFSGPVPFYRNMRFLISARRERRPPLRRPRTPALRLGQLQRLALVLRDPGETLVGLCRGNGDAARRRHARGRRIGPAERVGADEPERTHQHPRQALDTSGARRQARIFVSGR